MFSGPGLNIAGGQNIDIGGLLGNIGGLLGNVGNL